ncbi:MAG: winged helix-turn-helix transcriptional regulator [Deltaproteobacteria bacterium]|nr:winged helix-turn-helix transcriptional regulator [Deltaproteobacteria bacterium]
MDEKLYRQSRLCRTLGNPVAYAILAGLAEKRQMTPTEIARAVNRSVARVSNLLAALRLADVVRYEAAGGHTKYRLKHLSETRRLLRALADFVEAVGPPR